MDFASYCIGSSPVEIWATSITTDNGAITAEDSCSITIKYKDGSLATIVYVALGSGDLAKERCEVFADGSVAVMDNFETTVCMGKRGKRSVKGKQRKGFGEELAAFVNAVRSGGAQPIPLDSLFETTAVTFAILESMRSGEKRSIV